MKALKLLFPLTLTALLAACAYNPPMGMVVDPHTGIAQGSLVERNVFIDAAQFENRKLKVSVRNTSGDTAFNLSSFKRSLEDSYRSKGYVTVEGDDFGIRLDINVLYSGQATRNMAAEFGLLGAAAGGIAGYRSPARAGTTIGVVSGVALGTILGSYVTENTYIVLVEVSIGVIQPGSGEAKKTIIFDSGRPEEEREASGFKAFSRQARTRISSYAGGRNISQADIALAVKQRIARILADVI